MGQLKVRSSLLSIYNVSQAVVHKAVIAYETRVSGPHLACKNILP